MNLTNDDVQEILRLLDASSFDEFILETDRFKLTLRKSSAGGWTQERQTLARAHVSGSVSPPTAEPRKQDAPATVAPPDGVIEIRPPIMGTFYRAPKPGAAPFVEIGSQVEAETVVGIIETMKLMNSVYAGAHGTVSEICVANGELVERAARIDAATVARDMRLRRILIANRGEIAVRIIRTCNELGIETVLAASEADLDSVPARLADRTICIGPPAPASSYLNAESIVSAAMTAKAEAVHPGYGFLAENSRLASRCAQRRDRLHRRNTGTARCDGRQAAGAPASNRRRPASASRWPGCERCRSTRSRRSRSAGRCLSSL